MLCGRRRELVVSIAIVLASTAGVSSFKHIAHPSGHKAALLQQGITMSKLEVSIFASSDAAAAASPASKPAPTLVQQVRRPCGGLSKCVHDPRLRAALSFSRFRLTSPLQSDGREGHAPGLGCGGTLVDPLVQVQVRDLVTA
jgi:hypothetical protein